MTNKGGIVVIEYKTVGHWYLGIYIFINPQALSSNVRYCSTAQAFRFINYIDTAVSVYSYYVTYNDMNSAYEHLGHIIYLQCSYH